MKYLFIVLGFILLITPARALAVEATPYGSSEDFYYSQTITGQVIDNVTNQAISGARVTAECADISQCAHLYYYDDTDSNGGYTIDWLPIRKTESSAKYNLKASRTPYYIENNEYNDSERTITVTPYLDYRGKVVGSITNNNLAQNFSLEPKPANLTIKATNADSSQAAQSVKILISINTDFSDATVLETSQDGIATRDFNAGKYYIITEENTIYYASDSQTIDLSRGQNANLEFRLKEKPAVKETAPTQNNNQAPPTDTSTDVTSDTPVVGSDNNINSTTNKNFTIYFIVGGVIAIGLIISIFFLIRKKMKKQL